MNNKAFTLIELIIVIAIIGVVAASIFVAINPAKRLGKAKDAQRLTEANNIEEAIDRYTADNRALPASLASLSNYIPYMITITTNTNLLTCQEVLGGINQVNIGTELSDYLPSLPIDPSITSEATSGTGYYLVKTNDLIEVTPCDLYDNNDIPSSGLVLAMRMDEDPSSNSCSGGEDVCDYSGNAYDGTSSGSMTSSDIVRGQVGGAIDFDGSDDHVEVASAPFELDVFSVATWFKYNGSHASLWSSVVSVGNLNSGYGWALGTSNSNTNIGLWADVGGTWAHTGSIIVTADEWTHIVATFDGTTVSIYKNAGTPVTASRSGTIGDYASVSKLYIGEDSTGGRNINASIDQVSIWNKALTAQEVTDIYNLQK